MGNKEKESAPNGSQIDLRKCEIKTPSIDRPAIDHLLLPYVLVQPQLGEPRRLERDVLDVEADGRLGLLGAAGLARGADVGAEGRER